MRCPRLPQNFTLLMLPVLLVPLACGEAPTRCLEGRCGPLATTPQAICAGLEKEVLRAGSARFFSGATVCEPGTLSDSAYEEALGATNHIRAILGLPPARMDARLHAKSQACAAMMSASETLSHDPAPSWPCYSKAGAEAASESNLSHNRLNLGWSLGRKIMDFFIDPGLENQSTVGHRRWMLSARPPVLGLGYHESPKTGRYGLCYNVLGAPEPPSGLEPIAYPSNTFPLSLLTAPAQIVPWSVSFPAGLHADGVDVELHKLEDGEERALPIQSVRISRERFADPATVIFVPARPPQAGRYRYRISAGDWSLERSVLLVDCAR